MSLELILGGIVAALIAIVGAFYKGKKAGGDAVKAKVAEKTLEDVKTAHEISENVRTLFPDELDSRLRKYQRPK